MAHAGIGASRSGMHGGGYTTPINIVFLALIDALGWFLEPREFYEDWKEDRRIARLIKSGRF